MYKISIDTGGTFTDCICEKGGEISRLKLLSKSVLRSEIVEIIDENSFRIKENWGFEKDFFEGFFIRIIEENDIKYTVKSLDPIARIIELFEPFSIDFRRAERSFELFTEEEVPVFATRLLTQTPLNQSFPKLELKLGSTKGTNALLEHKGAKVLFIVTKGFKDLLEIGNQARPDIFAINILKPKPLHHQVLEVDEQIDSCGRILVPINLQQVLLEITEANIDFESIAICFKNSYRNAIHEQELTAFLSEKFKDISISTTLSSQIKFVPRAETTVVNAYLAPIINSYIHKISEKLNADFLVMTSAGNLVKSNLFHPKDSLLSGPAGGIVGAANMAKKSGFNQIISFDMGGTSTDVARFAGDFDFKSEINIGSATIFSPALAIETVAAGGGSICNFDGFKLSVGPESAGSSPGPACYGADGPLTITDVNLLLGRLETSQFSIPIFPIKAENKLIELLQNIEKQTNKPQNKAQVLESFLQIANEKMSEAIRKISVSKGFDPKEYALVAFGGAGGMHACGIAKLLNINKIIIPADAGLLSAYGISQSKIQKIIEKPVLIDFIEANLSIITEQFKLLEISALAELDKLISENSQKYIKKRTLKLRLKGQDSSLDIDFENEINFKRDIAHFKDEYLKIYGHWHGSKTIELASILVQVSEKEELANDIDFLETSDIASYFPDPDFYKSAFLEGNWQEIPVYIRQNLEVGAKISGMALLIDPFATTVIEKDGF